MTNIKRLIKSYESYISVPWRTDIAAAQRVIFCVYNEKEELTVRGKIDEFEIVTKNSGHSWVVFDLTNSFADWLSSQKYVISYFKRPDLLQSLMQRYTSYIKEEFEIFLKDNAVTNDTVVALKGVGSLFGFVRVKTVTDLLSPLVMGKLLVFFPGSYENNNFRLLDGYDGWDYLAVTITAENNFD